MITTELISTTEIIISSISVFLCLLVVNTYLLFKDICCLRCIELSVYAAISDMFGSISIAIGS